MEAKIAALRRKPYETSADSKARQVEVKARADQINALIKIGRAAERSRDSYVRRISANSRNIEALTEVRKIVAEVAGERPGGFSRPLRNRGP